MIEWLEVPLPTKGLNKNWAISDQPILTTRSTKNMRPFQRDTGRVMLSARSGLSGFVPGYVTTQGLKVQDLASIAYNARHVSYAADSAPDELWGLQTADLSAINRIYPGLDDDFFFIESNRTLTRVNRYGVVISRVDIPPPPASPPQYDPAHTFEVIGTGDDGAVYVGTVIQTGASALTGAIFKFVESLEDRTKYELQWWIRPPMATSGQQYGMPVRAIGWQGKIYVALNYGDLSGIDTAAEVWSYENVETSTGPQGAQLTLLAQIDDGNLDSLAGLSTVWTGGGKDAVIHDMDLRTHGPLELAVCGSNGFGTAGTLHFLVKLKPGGSTWGGSWIGSTNYAVQNDGSSALDNAPPNALCGGIGYACRFNNAGHVLSMGPRNTNDASSGTWLRYFVDSGTAWNISGGSTWQAPFSTYLGAAGNAMQYGYPVMSVDEFGNTFAPTCRNTAGVKAAHVFKASGVLFTSIGHLTGSPATATNNLCTSAVLASTVPDFQPDDYHVAEVVFVCGSPVTTLTATSASAHGYRILAAVPTTTSPRGTRNVAVSGGAIKTFTQAGFFSPTNYTGRTTPLSADARFVQSCALQGKLYFTDGIDYAVYDPAGTLADPNGRIDNLAASTLGVIPPRARLIAAWRSRLVLGRFPDQPYNWHMSAFGDTTNWDLFPSDDPIATQSIAGNVSPAGLTPDIINALIAYSDDYLIFGGDHSIRILAGDPMEGGRVGQVSDETGIAFGSPWCKDPEGFVYFFGSRGGIYRMHPQSPGVQWLTKDTIEDDLADIDLGSNYVRLCWNARDTGLHVFVMPYGVGGTHLRHYFWSAKVDAWFQDEFGTASDTTIQPTACVTIDGDLPSDRRFLIGTEDGRIMLWDSTATLDGTLAIDHSILIGPFAPKESVYETRFQRPSVVLSRAGKGTHLRFFVSPDDTLPGQPTAKYKLVPGRNPYLPLRAKGSYCYMEFRGTEPFSIESVKVGVSQGGRKRVYAR